MILRYPILQPISLPELLEYIATPSSSVFFVLLFFMHCKLLFSGSDKCFSVATLAVGAGAGGAALALAVMLGSFCGNDHLVDVAEETK